MALLPPFSINRDRAKSGTNGHSERSSETKSDLVVADDGSVPVADSRAERLWRVRPGTPAQNALSGVATRPDRAVSRCAQIVRMPVVLAPFPYVAMQVIKPKPVGRK